MGINWRMVWHMLGFVHRFADNGDCDRGINLYTYPWPRG